MAEVSAGEKKIFTEQELLEEGGREIIEDIHVAVVEELQKEAIELGLGVDEIKAFIDHVDIVHDMAMEMIDELKAAGAQISEEEVRAVEIDAYLHDARKFVPEAARGKSKNAAGLSVLLMHGEASAVFAEELLLKMGFSREYAKRRAQDIREHMGMPYVALEAKVAGVKDEAIEKAWRAWEKLEEGEKKELGEPPKKEVMMPWGYQPGEPGPEEPTSVPAAIVRAADFLSLGQLKGGFDKIVYIGLKNGLTLDEAIFSAQKSFGANVTALRTSKNPDSKLRRMEYVLGSGKYGDSALAGIVGFRMFIKRRKDVGARQEDGSLDVEGTIKNFCQAAEEFERDRQKRKKSQHSPIGN